MDGDDAPQAGNDSGKHGCIFAGIQGASRERLIKPFLRWLGALPCGSTVFGFALDSALNLKRNALALKLVAASNAGVYPQVGAYPFSG